MIDGYLERVCRNSLLLNLPLKGLGMSKTQATKSLQCVLSNYSPTLVPSDKVAVIFLLSFGFGSFED